LNSFAAGFGWSNGGPWFPVVHSRAGSHGEDPNPSDIVTKDVLLAAELENLVRKSVLPASTPEPKPAMTMKWRDNFANAILKLLLLSDASKEVYDGEKLNVELLVAQGEVRRPSLVCQVASFGRCKQRSNQSHRSRIYHCGNR
jgi:hypothetical protein